MYAPDDDALLLNESESYVTESQEELVFNPVLSGYQCAAHTLHLAVLDALKNPAATKLVNCARKVVLRLRNPTVRSSLRNLKHKKPILDNSTRWSSTCNMLERLLQLRGYCDSMSAGDSALKVPELVWDRIGMLYEALLPARRAPKVFQSEQLVVGDFYARWLKCEAETEKIGTTFAKLLLSRLKARKVPLVNKVAFKAGLFLDPR